MGTYMRFRGRGGGDGAAVIKDDGVHLAIVLRVLLRHPEARKDVERALLAEQPAVQGSGGLFGLVELGRESLAADERG